MAIFMVALWNRADHYIFILSFALSGSLEMQDAKKSRQKSPSGHHRTTLSGYIFATKAKKLVVLHMSPRYGELRPLAAEIDPVV